MIDRISERTLLSIAAAVAVACTGAPVSVPIASPSPSPAQRGAVENLQVLPPDIGRDSLIATMGGFTRALGVNCSYCHVSRSGGRPAEDEFALDDKETKRVARAMMVMVSDINRRHLPATGRAIAPQHAVTCATCHHGLARPRSLEVELLDRYEAFGLDSTISRFRQLRNVYLERGAYDFSDIAIPTAADRIAATPARRADALALMRLNLEFHPNSWFTYQQMGQLQVATGDTTAAIESYRRGLEINPTRRFLQQLLDELTKKP